MTRACVPQLCWPLATVLALTLAGMGTARANSHRYCHPANARTIKSNDKIRVYSVPGRYGGRDVWACLYKTGRHRRLGARNLDSLSGGETVWPVRLSGTLVGFDRQDYDHYGGSAYAIAVRDMRTGRLVHGASQAGGGIGGGTPWEVDDFVMDPAGSVAWIAQATDGSYVSYVYEADTTKGAQALDSGATVDPKSLRRHGRVVTWLNGGQTRMAQFVR